MQKASLSQQTQCHIERWIHSRKILLRSNTPPVVVFALFAYKSCLDLMTLGFAARSVRLFAGCRHFSSISTNSGKLSPLVYQRPIFLDSQSTTQVDPRVLDVMLPLLTWEYGNPHSTSHVFGWETEVAVERARGCIASLIGAHEKEIVFTSGATESNNMAIKGIARFYKAGNEKRNHIITLQTEHKCVLDSCRQLQQEGFRVTYLPVKTDGLVDMEVLKQVVNEHTLLVSVMAVNNEIGVIQPLKEIGAVVKAAGAYFHSDIAQAAGKIPIDVNDLNLDAASISGHKMYGPKGVGALFVRRRPRVRLEAIINGGGQERGMRSGTLPAPLCVGMGKAAAVCAAEMAYDTAHVNRLWSRLYGGITTNLSHVFLNGHATQRYKGNLNASFAYVEGESLLMALKEVAVSSGSACTSASLEPSYVLRALNVDEDLAHSSLRFGIGRFTTDAEVDFAVSLCTKHVSNLRYVTTC
jgi:cysteine desulfurase